MSFLPHTAFSQAFVILTCLVICFASSSFDALGVDLLGQFQLPEVSSLKEPAALYAWIPSRPELHSLCPFLLVSFDSRLLSCNLVCF
jgi:hypothetical protein